MSDSIGPCLDYLFSSSLYNIYTHVSMTITAFLFRFQHVFLYMNDTHIVLPLLG